MLYKNIKELAVNKLLLLFIIQEVQTPLTGSQITRIVLENSLMNYFALQQFLGELAKDQFITYYEDKGKHYYRIENKGIDTLKLFVNRIPQKQKQYLHDYISENIKLIKKEKQIMARYTIEGENQYLINLKLIEGEKVSMDLDLRIYSHKHAKQICNNWNESGANLYGQVLNMLIKGNG